RFSRPPWREARVITFPGSSPRQYLRVRLSTYSSRAVVPGQDGKNPVAVPRSPSAVDDHAGLGAKWPGGLVILNRLTCRKPLWGFSDNGNLVITEVSRCEFVSTETKVTALRCDVVGGVARLSASPYRSGRVSWGGMLSRPDRGGLPGR